ncbi:D-alanyl-D-alanine carboxypeptidase/D-alanyl-D-alanine endopeptidase [Caldimonas aquatica]|uniref:D-alanyl-D-alanine carboxypeptidase/D-alanyl-D-alanine-endopeptidase n=1 Tax=Caldimonas aquatica TaxID=376175 RepID=A0ABY6MQR0_9BURK|nr:D-alanyl-D-alanine carboxypeptidase/D-alanyl-D-alanine-endopeptidase [Schlegelella aquatica]UZD54339.1 D-alanyl-D-alanine carboxypeptidase/D-alanyl-D-alanine-endopeptidase [Schlegelella aquatica]
MGWKGSRWLGQALVPWVVGLWLLGASAARAALPAEVEAHLARAGLGRDSIAVVVAEAGAGGFRWAHREHEPVNPASLIKLVTTQAAFELLGPTYTWTTPVHVDGPVRDGVLQGSLYLRGTGDPKLVVERLWLLLRRVRQLGIEEIAGDIVLDRSAFQVPQIDPASFDGEPYRPYNVQPDALLVNFKSVALTFVPDPERGMARVVGEPPLAGVATDAVVPLDHGAPCTDWRAALKAELADASRIRFRGAYPLACGERTWHLAAAEPDRYNARAVEGLWRLLGGRLAGTVREGIVPPGAAQIAASESPPLAEIARDINKHSNNTMAAQVFLTLGLVRFGVGSPDEARRAVMEWAASRWPEAALQLQVDNGTGLSRRSRLTAALLARMLQAAWAAPYMPEFVSSLPVSGLDGTRRRARGASGVSHLKTGSLRDVAAIAGYVLSSSGRRYVLVAIVNHPQAGAARPALEALADWVARDLP